METKLNESRHAFIINVKRKVTIPGRLPAYKVDTQMERDQSSYFCRGPDDFCCGPAPVGPTLVTGLLQTQQSNVTSLYSASISKTPEAKARVYVFTGVGLCVCLSVCLSVTTITKKFVDGFVPNFIGRFLGRKGTPSFFFVTMTVCCRESRLCQSARDMTAQSDCCYVQF